MTRMRMTLVLVALALAGCGSTYSASAVRDADERAQAAYAACDAQLRAGALTSYRQAAECARPRVLSIYQQSGYPYMDLVILELAARAIGAEHIDTGFANPDDVARDILTLEQRIAAERQRRREGEMVAGGSSPYLPPERLLVGLDSLTSRQLPSQGANCFAVGGFTHCN
jgi:hypothetical protein